MKCSYSENDLALFAGNDLEPAKMDEIDAHLPLCETCRQLVQDLRETELLFRSARQDTVNAAALGRVRGNVLEQLALRSVRTSWGRWVYALAGVGFAVVVCIGLWSSLPRENVTVISTAVPEPLPRLPVSPAPSVSSTDSDVRPTVSAPRVKPVRRHPQRETREETPSSESSTEIAVKLLTDDPNIIIYWLVDQKGGSL
jgi:hypothetical protein